MDTTAQAGPGMLEISPTTPAPVSDSMEMSSNDADIQAHSDDNILQWMKYLPDDCINRMIEMGWDVST